MSLRYLSILFFASLAITLSAQRPQPFEGIITYVVETTLKQDSSIVNKHYAQKYGDTLTVYYHKNGSERREYQHTGSYGLEYVIYNKINNEEYTKWYDLDYVVYQSAADSLTSIDSITYGNTAVILGDTCHSITTQFTLLKSGESERKTLYFSKNEHILPHAFSERKFGHYDNLYNSSKSIFRRLEFDMQHALITFTAISIERKQLDPNLFIIPKGLTKNKKMF